MKHLVLLASVCALILPGLALAQEEPTSTTPVPAEEPETQTQTQTETAPAPAPPPPEPQVLADETKDAPAPKPKAIAAASGSVTIADFSFTPGSLTISQGDTVTWVNNGPTPHSATANDGSFNTGILKAGQSASHTFSQAGTFSYYCQPHPFMKATVVVQAAQAGGGSGGTSGADTSAGATSSSNTGATASQADQGPTLPNTGGDSAPLLLLGGLLLALGFAVHRRTAAE
ncbi:MAG TPA: cupredoxin family copper-binding protein [Thermoleophilaceae bacterium]